VVRINSLEAKIKELTFRNEALLKKISEKQFRQNETMLKSIFSKYFDGKKPSTTNNPNPTSPLPDQLARIGTMSLENYLSHPEQQKSLQNNPPKSTNSPNTSDNTISTEGHSNIDSYLAFEYNQGEYLRSIANPSGQDTSNRFNYSNSNHENTSFLVKRKMNLGENITQGDSFATMHEQSTTKLPCFGISEEAEEQKLNLMDFNLPFFTPSEQDERHLP